MTQLRSQVRNQVPLLVEAQGGPVVAALRALGGSLPGGGPRDGSV